MTKKVSNALNIVLNVFLVIAIIVTAYFIFYSFTHFSSNVQGTSMLPTYNSNGGEDRILASKIAHYSYGDVVILSVQDEENQKTKDIIKRVYAFGGDSVDMKFDGHYLSIIVNGEVVSENQYSEPIDYNGNEPLTYINFCTLKNSWRGEGGGSEPIILPENTIFVLGDNRLDSSDSATHGAYDISSVKAKVLTTIAENSFAPFELLKYYL